MRFLRIPRSRSRDDLTSRCELLPISKMSLVQNFRRTDIAMEGPAPSAIEFNEMLTPCASIPRAP